MCFTSTSRPPIAPIAGGALDSRSLSLEASDGNRLDVFAARAAAPTGAGIVIVPDVRGLHHFFEELALRFAESGVDAVALDLFGRTAAGESRGDDFEYMPHVMRTTYAGLTADTRAAAGYLRSAEGGAPRSVFVVGFCFGGRLAFDTASLGLGLAGVIGFYGNPVGPGRSDIPAPMDLVDAIECPVLGLFGGTDQSIPPEVLESFDTALGRAGVDHRIVSYPDAPHSFFDRSYEQHAAASADAWQQVLGFIHANTAPATA
ncbi:MAG: dienelactone hydrolase family protein [Candidatus Limnocylindrales bacterium]